MCLASAKEVVLFSFDSAFYPHDTTQLQFCPSLAIFAIFLNPQTDKESRSLAEFSTFTIGLDPQSCGIYPTALVKMAKPTAPSLTPIARSDEVAIQLAESVTEMNLEHRPSTTLEQDKSQPPTPDGTGRPANFDIITPGIYRSSFPSFPHFETLADLELKTIITFVDGPLDFAYANFITSNGITHYHIHVKANKDDSIYSDQETIYQILDLMLDPENYPMLIHCNKGKHRTGCISACFRRVTGWTTEAAIEEYVRYA